MMNNIETGLFISQKPHRKTRMEPTPIPLTGVSITGDILGRTARVKVIQAFKNLEKKPIEAVYRFPLPESAAVSNFTARIGDRTITGRIEERERAFEIYDDALSHGHGAYLMDQERPNIFTLSVGNLNPDTEAAIEIEYVQLLDMEGPRVRFSLPTTISPRYIPPDMDKGATIPTSDRVHPEYACDVPYGLTLSLNVHEGRLLESIESPSHPISVDMKSDPVCVSLSSDSTRLDRDFILYLDLDKATAGRAYSFATENGTFVQLDMLLTKDVLDQTDSDSPKANPSQSASPQTDSPRSESHESDSTNAKETLAPPKKEVVFLIDCSGSMQGDSIREARKALEICTRALEPGSSFNIVRFGSYHESLYSKSRLYEEKSLGQALSYLNQTKANLGGTEVFGPLKFILESSPPKNDIQRTVILITDGEVANEDPVMRLVRSHSTTTTLFTIGIGAGCNEHLIKGLARAGNGASEFIYPGERIEPKVLRLFQKVSDFVLTDAAITWPADSITEAPSHPAFFLDSPVTVFARCDSPLTADTITVSAKLNGRAQTWEFPVAELKESVHPIALFWARERIRDLEERGLDVLGPGSKQKGRKARRIEDHVLELSKQFGLLSQWTSFVAAEEREEKDKQTGELQLRKVPVPVTVGWHGMGSLHSQMWMCQESAHVSTTLLAETLDSDLRFSKARFFTSDAKHVRAQGPIDHLKHTPLITPPTDTDLILTILTTQKAGGGLELTEELAELLEIDFIEFKKAAAKLTTSDPSIDAYTLLSTILLLHVLETRFAAHSSTWSRVVKKSRKWLQKITDRHELMIGDEDINSWVETHLQSNG